MHEMRLVKRTGMRRHWGQKAGKGCVMGQPHRWYGTVHNFRCGESPEMASRLEHVNARIDDLHISRPHWSYAQGMEEMTSHADDA